MISIVKQYIEEQELLRKGQCYLVALSGGADSVALLLVLKRLGVHIEAVHCNFHLRGEESNRDENFVVRLCEQQGIPLHRIHFDTRTYAKLHHVSIEMAARSLRYSYFEQLRKDIGAEAICVAHHRDDSVETVLINLIRGTGIHGLTGIRPRQGYILRPLLCVSRKDIEKFLQHIGQSFVTDSSNLIDDVVRNKIRLNILPLMQEINPSIAESIQQTAERMANAERIYNNSIKQALESAPSKYSLEIKTVKTFAAPEALLFEWLHGFNFSPATIQQVYQHLDASTGKMWSSPTHDLIINRGQLLVEEREMLPQTMIIPETGCYTMSETLKMRFTITTDIKVNRSSAHACLDADKVIFPLTVRPVQEGDRFVPFGMKGSKLVSDFLTDLKLSLFERRRQLVITDASNNILWLVGLRPNQHFCINASTSRMLDCQIVS